MNDLLLLVQQENLEQLRLLNNLDRIGNLVLTDMEIVEHSFEDYFNNWILW